MRFSAWRLEFPSALVSSGRQRRGLSSLQRFSCRYLLRGLDHSGETANLFVYFILVDSHHQDFFVWPRFGIPMLVLSESTSIKLRPTVGSLCRMLFSIRLIASSSSCIQTTEKSDVHIHEHLVRSQLHREKLSYVVQRRIAADDFPHSSSD